jgi:hypothetical protein
MSVTTYQLARSGEQRMGNDEPEKPIERLDRAV